MQFRKKGQQRVTTPSRLRLLLSNSTYVLWKTMSSSDTPWKECTNSILNSPEAACLHQILKLAPETSTNAAVAFSVFWGEGGWSYLWAVETRCSSHLICFLFGSGFNGSSVEPSFSPAPVTQRVNAGLKSHWLMLSDSGWQLQGEYWSFSVGLWWSLCE